MFEFIALIVALCALGFAYLTRMQILSLKEGNDKMVEISSYIREGAEAYMKRQYRTIVIIAVILAVVLLLINDGGRTSFAFIVGAGFSALAGFIGMNTSVRANVRTAQAARQGLNGALRVAFRGGSVSGLSVVGLSLAGVTVFYILFNDVMEVENPILPLVGFGFGASLVSLFARVGGGIYTKAADVGADLVGKVEAGIPEDDPRNPAVIADNVGDNVGDCAGMGADLFETFAVTLIASMLLGELIFGNIAGVKESKFIVYPMALGAMGIIASIIATFFVRLSPGSKNIMNALYKGVIMAALVSAFLFLIITVVIFDGVSWGLVNDGLNAAGKHEIDGEFHLYGAALVGIVVTAGMIIITEYYTSQRYKPVKRIAKESETGAGTNVIAGLAVGFESTAIPMVIIGMGILVAFELAGLYGIGIAAAAMLSTTGIIVALDTYGPITDNAGGIAEMAGLSGSVRETTDQLDAVGNTTKAVTKGYAIGSAALAALALFADYVERVIEEKGDIVFNISDPYVLVGLFVGAMLPFLFSSFCMGAVGRAAREIVKEVRRQFREKPGIMEGKDKPDYGKCVDIVTLAALREMRVPALMAVIAPVAVGFLLGPEAVGGLLIGVIASGLMMALMMANGGGAWDNAKKYIEDGHLGGKGSDAHKAAVVGDTVGDPYKDTAGPAINALIKVINTVSLILAALFASHALF